MSDRKSRSCNREIIKKHSIQELAKNLVETKKESIMEELYNKFRIPDAIKDIQKFDGLTKNTLNSFIKNVEGILELIPKKEQDENIIILQAIRNKIVDRANDILNMYNTPLVWKNIKENLISNYSDKRNETSLVRDLHKLYQGYYDTVEIYYAKVVNIFSTIVDCININEKTVATKKSKTELYETMCLDVFLSGLREPLGSTVRASQPNNLTDAYAFCIKEQNILYIKNKPFQNYINYNQPRYNYKPANQYRQPVQNIRSQFQNPQSNYRKFKPIQTFNQSNNNYQRTNPPIRYNYSNYQNQSKTNQNNHPNYSNYSNQFKQNQNNQPGYSNYQNQFKPVKKEIYNINNQINENLETSNTNIGDFPQKALEQ